MTMIEQRTYDALARIPRALDTLTDAVLMLGHQRNDEPSVPGMTKFYVTFGLDHPWSKYAGVIYADSEDHARLAANKIFGRGKWCSVQENRPGTAYAELPPIVGWEFGDLDWELCRIYE